MVAVTDVPLLSAATLAGPGTNAPLLSANTPAVSGTPETLLSLNIMAVSGTAATLLSAHTVAVREGIGKPSGRRIVAPRGGSFLSLRSIWDGNCCNGRSRVRCVRRAIHLKT